MNISIVNRINFSLLSPREGEPEYELICLEECPGGLISILLAPKEEKAVNGE